MRKPRGSAARWRAWRAASSAAASSRCSSAKGWTLEVAHRARTIPLARMCPKTLTGDELELDDAPAREAELFLVDGNNLAYRAFFALPEELATSDGFPTNALLGFTNMLFKLLSDYRPKGVAVAWDTRPVHRAELADDVQGGPPADAGPAARAVPVLPADRRGVRLPQPRVRGLGGGRRDRHARHARRRGGDQDVRRLHRPRRVPALLGRTSA